MAKRKRSRTYTVSQLPSSVAAMAESDPDGFIRLMDELDAEIIPDPVSAPGSMGTLEGAVPGKPLGVNVPGAAQIHMDQPNYQWYGKDPSAPPPEAGKSRMVAPLSMGGMVDAPTGATKFLQGAGPGAVYGGPPGAVLGGAINAAFGPDPTSSRASTNAALSMALGPLIGKIGGALFKPENAGMGARAGKFAYDALTGGGQVMAEDQIGNALARAKGESTTDEMTPLGALAGGGFGAAVGQTLPFAIRAAASKTPEGIKRRFSEIVSRLANEQRERARVTIAGRDALPDDIPPRLTAEEARERVMARLRGEPAPVQPTPASEDSIAAAIAEREAQRRAAVQARQGADAEREAQRLAAIQARKKIPVSTAPNTPEALAAEAVKPASVVPDIDPELMADPELKKWAETLQRVKAGEKPAQIRDEALQAQARAEEARLQFDQAARPRSLNVAARQEARNRGYSDAEFDAVAGANPDVFKPDWGKNGLPAEQWDTLFPRRAASGEKGAITIPSEDIRRARASFNDFFGDRPVPINEIDPVQSRRMYKDYATSIGQSNPDLAVKEIDNLITGSDPGELPRALRSGTAEFKDAVRSRVTEKLLSAWNSFGTKDSDLNIFDRFDTMRKADLGGTTGGEVLRETFGKDAIDNVETLYRALEASRQLPSQAKADSNWKNAYIRLAANRVQFFLPSLAGVTLYSPAGLGAAATVAAAGTLYELGADGLGKLLAKKNSKFFNFILDAIEGGGRYTPAQVAQYVAGLRSAADRAVEYDENGNPVQQ